MTSSTVTKIRASADLVRMDLALGAGFFLVAGEILAAGGLPPIHQVLLGFLTLFFISGSANISNDYFDREVDRINLPSRPLPSGRISVRELLVLFVLFTAAGLTTAAFLGSLVLALVSFLWVIAFLYNMKLKESGFFGNLIVATCLGMIFILAGILAGTLNGVVLTFAALAFFFDLGEEIAGDAMDVKGDQVRSSKSLAKRWGRDRAMRISGLMFGVFVLLTLLPFLMGWLGYDYLILIAITDLWMIFCSRNLMRCQMIEEGRVQIRRLYLAWGLFVFVFAVTRIL
jgi:geranylgeranylglycerol-phosphate geranylgeranyltransferase